ncbi:hypothetical protein ASF70_02855 [Rhizobium sp. Leaf321]|uniref:enoyl-CoA hydratase/isomerase family protein n=1 Tax=Rhizobium sp. Leaf321 TaxID=1736335 RepID=UPI0007158811|nr:enoyl-CoA hydratase-related protein [Rhizobium sp. Leaf321]KQQ74855.1 hypothetical protein ASF70_02855 [Rhizobium sp. Leaf321]
MKSDPDIDGEVRYDLSNGVATISICREHKRNALTPRHFSRLVDLLEKAASEASVRAIVLTGEGERSFCSGADISSKDVFWQGLEEGTTTGLGDYLRCCRLLSKPLIGRINGHCYAGGLGLLAACDLAVACDDVRFCLPEIKLGLFPYVVLAGFDNRVSRMALTSLALSGLPISAAKALEIGMISHCVPRAELDEALMDLMRELTLQPARLISEGLRALKGHDSQAYMNSIDAAEARIRALASERHSFAVK